jgi:uncharacterized CHY-type Zn-finger protein
MKLAEIRTKFPKLYEEWQRLNGYWGHELDQRWSLQLNRRFTAALGRCSYQKGLIELGYRLVADNEDGHPEVIDTLRHEFAHALAGSAALHGPLWKSWAVTVGAKPIACYQPSDSLEETKLPARKRRPRTHKYVASCGCCGKLFESRGKPKTTRACPRCYRPSTAHLARLNYRRVAIDDTTRDPLPGLLHL